MTFTFPVRSLNFPRFTAVVLLLGLFVAPLRAQQAAPVASPGRAAPRAETPPAFDDLLSADAYKVYGEIRNVGQLLSSGGAAEIIDPITKLADPGPQFKSLVGFLKKNSEALAQSRLMFASWAVRTDVPTVFVAIEFPTNEDATKFAPRLETFLPTVLPPVPVTPEPSPENEKKPAETVNPATSPRTAPSEKPGGQPTLTVHPAVNHPSIPAEERLPFVITHAGNLVCISDKSFEFSKLHPKQSRPLFQDQNFRIARDQFSSEPIFVFFNVALEEKAKAKPSPAPFNSEAEANRRKAEDTDDSPVETPQEAARSRAGIGEPSPDPNRVNEQQMVVASDIVAIRPTPSPTPTPTKQEQSQQIASRQIGHMLDAIGYGEPQWPEAVGLAVALDGNEYILRAMMIDKPEAKKTPIPFIPQLIGGSPFTSDAAYVLPEDTDVLISASVDLTQTYDAMQKAAEARAKAAAQSRARGSTSATAEPVSSAEIAIHDFSEFEKKAGFNIKDDLLPAFGREIAVAGSLKTLQGVGGLNLGLRGPTTTAAETGADKDEQGKKQESVMPVLLIEVKDRDAARKLLPGVLNGLGIGEANLIAQTEKRDDTEMVNYAGMFAYAFVGDFLVVSDVPGVRKVVDAYVNHQTLSSNTVFRNSRRWQSNRTVGHIYVSPALMEGSQETVRKTSATMDPGLRDFLLGLNPTAEAITYALSDDGLGTRHELHLPKNLILMTVASISSATKNPPPEANEGMAIGMLAGLSGAEDQYKNGPGKGSYGSLQQLSDSKMFSLDMLDKYAAAYKFEVTINGDQFEAVATPKEYGKSGKRSFFVDKTGVVRGDDHGGGPATIADKVVQ
jgi:hypothetical protein